MKQSVESIIHCYERRSKDFGRLEGLAATQRHQILSMEAAISSLRREVAELKQERTSLHASHNSLLGRYTTLKKNASQLESFRQSIAVMVESAPAKDTDGLPAGTTPEPVKMTQFADGMAILTTQAFQDVRIKSDFANSRVDIGTEHRAPVGHSSMYEDHTMRSLDLSAVGDTSSHGGSRSYMQPPRRTSQKDAGRPGYAQSQQHHTPNGKNLSDNDKIDIHMGTTPRPRNFVGGGRASAPRSPSSTHDDALTSTSSDPPPPSSSKRTAAGSTTPTPHPRPSPVTSSAIVIAPVDAPALYKEIRNSLTPPEFEAFASNVAAFNAAEQTAHDTVRNIEGIVRNRRLCALMTSLIYTALDEGKGKEEGDGDRPSDDAGRAR
ncbi:hypothetical protein HKX48_002355 [Thoreauomyces humboldtii]|nr:hypothetical protein HKX48_002355 [Thoreauomyces humboldtii]